MDRGRPPPQQQDGPLAAIDAPPVRRRGPGAPADDAAPTDRAPTAFGADPATHRCRAGAVARRGFVENPAALDDEFVLAVPGISPLRLADVVSVLTVGRPAVDGVDRGIPGQLDVNRRDQRSDGSVAVIVVFAITILMVLRASSRPPPSSSWPRIALNASSARWSPPSVSLGTISAWSWSPMRRGESPPSPPSPVLAPRRRRVAGGGGPAPERAANHRSRPPLALPWSLASPSPWVPHPGRHCDRGGAGGGGARSLWMPITTALSGGVRLRRAPYTAQCSLPCCCWRWASVS